MSLIHWGEVGRGAHRNSALASLLHLHNLSTVHGGSKWSDLTNSSLGNNDEIF